MSAALADRLTMLVNTHSSCADVWPLFFGQLGRHWPGHPRVLVASDVDGAFGANARRVPYRAADPFAVQYAGALAAVSTPLTLTLQEDYPLYGPVDDSELGSLARLLLGSNDLDFVRLIRSGQGMLLPIGLRLHALGDDFWPRYSMQASLWRTEVLRALYAGRADATPWDAEPAIDREHGPRLRGAIVYRCEPRRGLWHWDSSVFPYVASALVKGRWNTGEYPELVPLLAEYGVDPGVRGES